MSSGETSADNTVTADHLRHLVQATEAAREHHEIDALIDHFPYAKWLGVRAHNTDDGILFRLPYREELIGNASLPALHGGAIAAFMETTALLTVLIAERQHRVPKPVDFSLDYLRSAKAQECYARCRIVRHGRRVVMAQVSCWQSDESRPISVARNHFLVDVIDARSADPAVSGPVGDRVTQPVDKLTGK